MVSKPAPGLLKAGDFPALLVGRSLRGEARRVLRCYEHAAIVCPVSASIRRVSIITRRARIAAIVAAMSWRIASSRVRGGAIVHRSHWLVLLNDLPRLTGPLTGRGNRQEGFARGALLIRLTSRVVGLLSLEITVAAFTVQAVSDARFDAEVGAEVEWLVVV